MYSVDEDSPDRCPESSPDPAKVGDHERVARMVHGGLLEKGEIVEKTFPTGELTAQLKDPSVDTEHCCGGSEGVSLQRMPPETHPSLAVRSEQLANGRLPFGAAFASAGDLRGIRLSEGDNDQVVFILPDGGTENPGHSVLRVRNGLGRGQIRKIRNSIMNIFRAEGMRVYSEESGMLESEN